MNKQIKVKVKTPLGESDSKEAGSGPSQGNVDAALISANSIGNGVKEMFKTAEKELRYANEVVVSALVFMDDIGKISVNREMAQDANDKIEEMINRKGLELNVDKSNFLIIGNKKEQKRIQKEIDKIPLRLCQKNMKQVKVLKYLGEFLTSDLSESVHQTVVKRVGVATLSIYEVRAVVED